MDALNLGVIAASFLATLLLFSVPVTLLAMTSPFAIRITLKEAEQAGNVSGNLYALSTVGSVLGAFLPTLLLFPLIGTSRTILLFGLLILLVAPFAAIALQFGPLEYTFVLLFAFTLLAGITAESPAKGILAIFAGVFLSTIGLDPVHSSQRMTFSEVHLYDGIDFLVAIVGLFALSEVLIFLEHGGEGSGSRSSRCWHASCRSPSTSGHSASRRSSTSSGCSGSSGRR